MQDFYSENCKILLKEIEDDVNRWRDRPWKNWKRLEESIL